MDCGRTFTTIDLTFLCPFPSIIIESFPFVVTSSTPGAHIRMAHQFFKSATNKVLLSTCADVANEMRSAKCCETIPLYHDSNHEMSSK